MNEKIVVESFEKHRLKVPFYHKVSAVPAANSVKHPSALDSGCETVRKPNFQLADSNEENPSPGTADKVSVVSDNNRPWDSDLYSV